jgi:hypothetical protein
MASANNAYWHGRVVRVYLSTIKWNWQQHQVTTAISRTLFTLWSFIRSAPHLLSADFWQALKAHHVPDTLHFVMKELEEQDDAK